MQTLYRTDRVIAHAKPPKPEPLNVPWNIAFLLARMHLAAHFVTLGKKPAEVNELIHQIQREPTEEHRKLVEELLVMSLEDNTANPRSYVMAKAARDEIYAGTAVPDVLHPPRQPGIWKASVVIPEGSDIHHSFEKDFLIGENSELYDSYRNLRRSLGRKRAAVFLQKAFDAGAEIQFEWIQSAPLDRTDRKRLVDQQDDRHFDNIKAALLSLMQKAECS